MSVGGLYIANIADALHTAELARPSSPSTFYRESLPRFGLYDDAGHTGHVALTTEVMTSLPIKFVAGEVVTNLSFRSGATAAGTPLNWWFALYDDSATPALLAQTADQTTTAWAANTTKTLALATAQTIDATGVYWVSIMMKATTVVTLLGTVCAPAIVTGMRNMSVSSGSALTATAPATIATPTAKQFAPYCVAT